jgi:arginase
MKILLLAAPYDSGHYKQRLGLGPLHLVNGIEKRLVENGHEVRKEEIFAGTAFSTEVTTSFEVSRKIAGQVKTAKEHGAFPIVLTGNCNAAAIGTLSGLQDGSGVIWFDCHGDFNTPETTIGGFLDGMALSMIAGHCWTQLMASVPGFKPVPENRIVLAGARDLDPLEANRLGHSDVTLITPETIKQGAGNLAGKLVPMEPVYLHIDLDVLDPHEVHANGYSTPGGITTDELCAAITLIRNKHRISAVALTAYDPSFDPQQKMQKVVERILEIVIP